MLQSYEQHYYESDHLWADGAGEDYFNLLRIRKTAELLLQDTESILDVGCGNGVFGKYILSIMPKMRVVGLDRSASALRHVGFEKLQGEVNALPFPDNSFDCVTCLEVIEHLPVEIFRVALSELCRVSRRQVIIGVPFREAIDLNATRCPSCMAVFHIHLHMRSFDESAMQSLLSGHGYQLSQLVFPDERTRKKYLHHITRLMKGHPKLREFTTQVCPVCGFKDTEKLQKKTGGATATGVTARNGSVRLLKRLIDPLWPVEAVPGYWVACSYTRDGAPD